MQVFEQTYPLASGGQFILQNVNGSVRVEGWNRNEVEVRAVKTSANNARDLALVKIDVESHPGEVDVHTLYPDGEDAEVAVEYIVHVPYRVLLHSIGTVNGSVSVHGVQGAGELRSVNGNVEVLNSSGRFSAHTTNGNLHLELSGLADGAPMDLETVNGSVTLGLPSNASADLNVRNMNGDVSSDVPVYFDGRASRRASVPRPPRPRRQCNLAAHRKRRHPPPARTSRRLRKIDRLTRRPLKRLRKDRSRKGDATKTNRRKPAPAAATMLPPSGA